MNPPVRFEHVSKAYRMGLGRTSLREALGGLLRGTIAPSERMSADKGILWALRDVTFEIPHGQTLGVIGPNGAGKTTILKLLARITQPTSGRIDVSGRVATLIELGAGFHPELTGRENIYLNGAILGMSRKEISDRFDRIVAFSGLDPFLDTPVKRYSSGMFVRLGFSVAAHVEPDILLVDEVLAVGDTQFRQRCAKRIQELRGRGTTIVFVAHNLFLVRSICERAIFVADGKIVSEGDVDRAIAAYDRWLRSQDDTPSRTLAGSVSISAIEIADVDLRQPGEETGDRLVHDREVEIRVHFRTAEAISRPNLILRVVRSDGIVSFMIRTRDLGYELTDLEGEGSISVIVDPLQLSPGSYTVDARITGAIDGLPLAQGQSPRFEVTTPGWAVAGQEGCFVPHVAQVRVSHRGGEGAPSLGGPTGGENVA